jgi:hypothetical protein
VQELKYLKSVHVIMAPQSPLISLNLCAPEGEKIGLEDAGNLLIALQDMVWHMGNYIEGQPYNERGRLKKQIIEDYGLVIKSLSSGSIVIEIGAQRTSTQATFDDGSISAQQAPINRAVTKVTDLFEAISNDGGRNLDDIITDIDYRNRFLSDVSNIWPKKRGYKTILGGQGGRIFDLMDSNRVRLERFVSIRPIAKDEEVRVGILALLRVENGKQMKIEKAGEEFLAEYPSDMEPRARDLLGSPVSVFGRAERISGQPKIKRFEILNIELFDKYPLVEFDFDGLKFTPNLAIETQVEYNEGFWTLHLPFIDAVGRAEDFYEAEKMLEEHVCFLWNEYVLCPEEDLGETGKMLRAILQEVFRVN